MKKLGWYLITVVQILLIAVLSTILMFVALFARVFGPDAPLRVAGRLWAPPLLWICGARYVVDGGDEVDWKRPHVFLMNHQSMLDIPAAFGAIRSPIRFMAKRILGHVPVLGWYMRATRMILVNRENGAEAVAAIQIAADRLRTGTNLLIYPEGTRSLDGRFLPFKRGPFELAIASQVSIVPLVIHGAAQVLPRGRASPRPGTIHVRIGAPISTDGLTRSDREALMRRVRDEMIAMHQAIGGAGGETTEARAERRRSEAAAKALAAETTQRSA